MRFHPGKSFTVLSPVSLSKRYSYLLSRLLWCLPREGGARPARRASRCAVSEDVSRIGWRLLVFTTALPGECLYAHFTDEEVQARRGSRSPRYSLRSFTHSPSGLSARPACARLSTRRRVVTRHKTNLGRPCARGANSHVLNPCSPHSLTSYVTSTYSFIHS